MNDHVPDVRDSHEASQDQAEEAAEEKDAKRNQVNPVVSVDSLRLSTPTNPQSAPPLGWRHDRVVCVVLEFQSGNAILAQVQGTCLD